MRQGIFFISTLHVFLAVVPHALGETVLPEVCMESDCGTPKQLIQRGISDVRQDHITKNDLGKASVQAADVRQLRTVAEEFAIPNGNKIIKGDDDTDNEEVKSWGARLAEERGSIYQKEEVDFQRQHSTKVAGSIEEMAVFESNQSCIKKVYGSPETPGYKYCSNHEKMTSTKQQSLEECQALCNGCYAFTYYSGTYSSAYFQKCIVFPSREQCGKLIHYADTKGYGGNTYVCQATWRSREATTTEFGAGCCQFDHRKKAKYYGGNPIPEADCPKICDNYLGCLAADVTQRDSNSGLAKCHIFTEVEAGYERGVNFRTTWKRDKDVCSDKDICYWKPPASYQKVRFTIRHVSVQARRHKESCYHGWEGRYCDRSWTTGQVIYLHGSSIEECVEVCAKDDNCFCANIEPTSVGTTCRHLHHYSENKAELGDSSLPGWSYLKK